jgi:hypothetical protein
VEQFKGYRYPDGNLLRWRSSFETNNLGFHIYRMRNAECGMRIGKAAPSAECLEKVTPDFIAGSAWRAGAGTRLTAGDSYSWWDAKGSADSVYWIEDIDLGGTRAMHGPVKLAAAARNEASPRASVSLLLNQLRPAGCGNGDCAAALREAPAETFARANQPQIAKATILPPPAAAQLRLAAGPAVKMSVRRAGWQRVSGSQLQAAGLPPDAEAKNLQLFLNGREIPLSARSATGRDDGPLGANGVIEFYGQGADTRETDAQTYWLTWAANGSRIALEPHAAPRGNEAPGKTATDNGQRTTDKFAFTIERKDRTLYAPGIRNGEAENFFGPAITPAGTTQTLVARDLAANAPTPATLEAAVQGATDGIHQVQVSLNDNLLGVILFNGQARRVQRLNIPAWALREGENSILLKSLNGSADVSVTDYLRLTYQRRYVAESNQLDCTLPARSQAFIGGFTNGNIRVFDITAPEHPFLVQARVENDGGGYAVRVRSQNEPRRLLAITDEQASAPSRIAANEPSAWTNRERWGEFIILTHRDFRAAAGALANARRGAGLSTEVITLEDIYDEWSGGAKDTAAVSAFLRWARGNWRGQPRYLLLLGDASFDPRNYLGFGDQDFAPTAYVDTTQLETASDDALADFNNDGLPELAVGRLPARTSAQAETMIAKTLAYRPAPENGALFVADRPDDYDFAALNREARRWLPDNMPFTELNRAEMADETMRAQILAHLNRGPALVNFAGHGSVEVWTGAGLLRSTDAAALNNGGRLPLVLAMTCLNGYFQDLYTESLGEALLKSPNGGAVAVWASTALTAAPGQGAMDAALLRYIYRNGAAGRLGDAVRVAKQATEDRETRQTWLLLGDPTLRVRE